jgi:AraC family transcriptional regulator
VKVALRSMDIRLSLAGRTVQDGFLTPGMFHVTEPSVPTHCLFRGPYNVMHLHIPNDLIAECAREMLGREVAVFYSHAKPAADPTVERLARALLAANLVDGSLARLYADCIGIATVARLVTVALRGTSSRQGKVSRLARWRLKRTIDYVDAHLAEPMTLAEIASVAGLTRMHFAAQFRAATGLRPHEYLLRRRVERAQDMFARTSMSIVDVALSVGFQNQSHFTRIFKRFVGEPPQSWCQSIDVERPVSTGGDCSCNARRR